MFVKLSLGGFDLVELFKKVRWSNGLYCPRCGCGRVWGNGRYVDGKNQVWNRYLCRGCGRTFNDKTDTLLHYSRLSL